jgi:hypothetical protein
LKKDKKGPTMTEKEQKWAKIHETSSYITKIYKLSPAELFFC